MAKRNPKQKKLLEDIMENLKLFTSTILEAVAECLADGQWHTLYYIHDYAEVACDKKISETNISARIREYRGQGNQIDWRYKTDKYGNKTTTSEYRLIGGVKNGKT